MKIPGLLLLMLYLVAPTTAPAFEQNEQVIDENAYQQQIEPYKRKKINTSAISTILKTRASVDLVTL